MAREKVICTCKKCGKKFEKIVEGCNRAEAERKALWAADAYDTCYDCYKAEKDAKIDEYIATLNLPEIQGVSEKQISFARDLRRKEIAEYYQYFVNSIKHVRLIIKNIEENRDALEAKLKEKGKTFEQYIDAIKESPTYGTIYIALTSTSARELIDILKR